MPETETKLGLKSRAVILRKKAKEAQDAPILTKAKLIHELGEGLAELLVDMADTIDSLTPYIDEDTADAEPA